MKTVRIIVDAKPSIDLMEIPSYGVIDVTDNLLKRIQFLNALCKEHGLSEVREFHGIQWFDEEEYRVDLEELCCDQNAVWSNAFIKHTDAAFYTSRIDVSKLEQTFESANDGDVIFSFSEEPIEAENQYEERVDD